MVARPLLTVTIATYNRAGLIGAAIERVLGQSWNDFELVVVDDGSTDATGAVVAGFEDPRVRYMPQANGGLSAARNAGAEAATGHHITFLDDDDLPHPDWLAWFASEIEGRDPPVVTCGCRLVDEHGAVQSVRLPEVSGGGVEGIYLPGTFTVRRDVYDRTGGFVVGLEASHQTEFSWRMLPIVDELDEQVVAIRRPLIDLVRLAPDDRPMMDPAKLLSGATYVLDHHQERFRDAPATHAHFLGIAGVAAARLGDYRLARRRFASAVRVHPAGWRNWARLGIASAPPLGGKVWSRHAAPDGNGRPTS